MKVGEKKGIRFRIIVVATFFFMGLATVLARAYQLQVLEKDRLNDIAEGGYIWSTKLPPKRGAIYDCEGHALAFSVEVGSVYAHPKRIKEKEKTARRLAEILKEKTNRIQKKLNSGRSFVWIKRRIAPDLAKRIKSLNLEGVDITAETRRYYPGKEIAAHLLGFVGTDNQGLEGLERKYEHLLRGPQDSLIQMRDALGRPFFINRPDNSNHEMCDLYLTIDKDIQYKAQQALKAAVKKSKAKGGQCLVVEPETGEIMAMAVVPEFNPNIFSKYSPDKWRNRTVTDCFEPGSTIKALLLAACLNEGILTPNSQFDCEQGEYEIGSKVIHDTHKFGLMSVSDIVVHSSNIGAAKMGGKLGYRSFSNYLKKFGFGGRSGVDLLGERKGFIRPVEKARQIDRATIYFGQGMAATSLQITMAMAAIANGGKLMRPYVVKKVANESGRIVERTRPKVIERVISPRTAKKVAKVLEGVVSDEGTAALAAISGFRVAGKTGTSQKVDPKTRRYSRRKYVATFVGFAPVDQPKLVILVMIDEPMGNYYGGVVAGPVFSEVGQWALSYLRINPQIKLVDETIERDTPEDLKKDMESLKTEQIALNLKEGLLPDFRGLGMREVLNRGRSLGLKVRLDGTGLAIKQIPAPGTSLKRIRSVKVIFRAPT